MWGGEDQLRRENDELRLRAEQFDGRNEELADPLPNESRPLIRQVEALQTAAEERERAKQTVDRSHMKRVRTAEVSAAVTEERERAAEEHVSDVLAKCATLEEQVRLSQADSSRAPADVHCLQADTSDREAKWRSDGDDALSWAGHAERDRDEARREVADARTGYMDALEAAEEREKSLRAQLATAETKMAMMMEREANRRAEGTSTDSFRGVAVSSASHILRERGVGLQHGSEDVSEEGRLVDGDGSTVAGVYATQRLSSSLWLHIGDVASLQAQLDVKEKATRALAEEVVILTAGLDQVMKEKAQSPDLSKKFDELQGRHGTLLELLGEREEHIGELEADLNDVKAMYKDQVTELLLRIEQMTA